MAKCHCITFDDITLIIKIWHYDILWHHQCHWKCLKKERRSYSLLSFWLLKSDPVLLLQVNFFFFKLTSFWSPKSDTVFYEIIHSESFIANWGPIDFMTSFWSVKSDTVLLPQVQNINFLWHHSDLLKVTLYFMTSFWLAKSDPSRFYDLILMCEKWHCITVTSTKY